MNKKLSIVLISITTILVIIGLMAVIGFVGFMVVFFLAVTDKPENVVGTERKTSIDMVEVAEDIEEFQSKCIKQYEYEYSYIPDAPNISMLSAQGKFYIEGKWLENDEELAIGQFNFRLNGTDEDSIKTNQILGIDPGKYGIVLYSEKDPNSGEWINKNCPIVENPLGDGSDTLVK